MRTVDETLIEKYVGFPETLDPETRAAVEECIRTDSVTREIADFYEMYYAYLRERGAAVRGVRRVGC